MLLAQTTSSISTEIKYYWVTETMSRGGGNGMRRVSSFGYRPTFHLLTFIADDFLQQSDEEVLRASDDDDDDDDDDEAFATANDNLDSDNESNSDAGHASDEQDEGNWGESKRDYYDADAIETEQDALDEETEARRLQQKRLKAMSAADYGFDEDEWKDSGVDESVPKPKTVTEVLPQLQISDDMSAADKLKLLKTRYPEFEHLSTEFITLQNVVKELEVELPTSPTDLLSTSRIKHRAAVGYLAALAMYFALLASPADDLPKNGVALAPNAIRAHPVMDSLLACRNLWTEVKDMPDDDNEEEDLSDDEEQDPESIESLDETNELDDEAVPDHIPLAPAPSRKRKSRPTAADQQAIASAARAERLAQATASLADLDSLIAKTPSDATNKPLPNPQPPRTRTHKPQTANDSDLEDESSLPSAAALAEKAAKRKSLRFYTSQIANTANRRGQAGRNAGGDDDVPHRERLRDRQERLVAAAQKRGAEGSDLTPGQKLGHDDDSDDGSADERDAVVARQQRDDASGYYDLIAGQSAAKRAEKKLAAEIQNGITTPGVNPLETVEGKRAIGYAIEKNKGLKDMGRGRNKKKDVSNPRVKKRLKYEAKKKKLASMKPVFKGGEGRGGYGGELTGIKTNVVRSTKL